MKGDDFHQRSLASHCCQNVAKIYLTRDSISLTLKTLKASPCHLIGGGSMKKTVLVCVFLFLLSLGFPHGGSAKIFIANESGGSLTVYAHNADGNASPLTFIQGDQTTLDHPQQIAVDDNWIYVPNRDHDSIDIFPIDATGNVAPTRSISGPTSTVDSPQGVAVDSNYIYVGNHGNNRILVFPKEANGDVAPSRYIEPSSGDVGIIAIDSNWIYVVDYLGHSLSVFPINASGTVAPMRKISGGTTTLGDIMGVAVDSNWIYVTNRTTQAIDIFPINANGNVAPTRVIQGSNTTFADVNRLAVDNEFIYVAQYQPPAITIFPIEAGGNVSPARTIQGGDTQLEGPFGIAVRQKIDAWTGPTSLSVKITFVETDGSGNQKFVTSNETFAGTTSLYLGENGPAKSAEGCFIKFLSNDGTTICINDLGAISTESIKSKSEKALFIGSGSFVTSVEGSQVSGMAYIDAKGTLKQDSSNNLISIGLSGKTGGGVDLKFTFSGSFKTTLTE
jgi:6-phosphogluconolactonase (cycloisomerase 2 family)